MVCVTVTRQASWRTQRHGVSGDQTSPRDATTVYNDCRRVYRWKLVGVLWNTATRIRSWRSIFCRRRSLQYPQLRCHSSAQQCHIIVFTTSYVWSTVFWSPHAAIMRLQCSVDVHICITVRMIVGYPSRKPLQDAKRKTSTVLRC